MLKRIFLIYTFIHSFIVKIHHLYQTVCIESIDSRILVRAKTVTAQKLSPPLFPNIIIEYDQILHLDNDIYTERKYFIMTSPDQFDKKLSFSRNAKNTERIQFKNISHG